MTLTDYVGDNNGKFVQFENDVADGGQCLPPSQVYMQQVLGIANPPLTASAKNYWLLFGQLGLGQCSSRSPAVKSNLVT